MQLIIYAKREFKSLKTQNTRAAYKICSVHMRRIFTIVSLWRNFLLDGVRS